MKSILGFVLPFLAIFTVVLTAPTDHILKDVQSATYQHRMGTYNFIQSDKKLENRLFIPIPQVDYLFYSPNALLLRNPLREEDNSFWVLIQQFFYPQPDPGAGSGEMDSGMNSDNTDIQSIKGLTKEQIGYQHAAEKILLMSNHDIENENKPTSSYRFYIPFRQSHIFGFTELLKTGGNPLLNYQKTLINKSRSISTKDEIKVNEFSSMQLPVKDAVEIDPTQSTIPEARFNSHFPALFIQADEDSSTLEGKNHNVKEIITDMSLDDMKEKIADDPSFARAGPSGVALAGKGGVASSRPVGTALVEDGGIAVASPQATSISGDFLGYGDKKSVKNKVL